MLHREKCPVYVMRQEPSIEPDEILFTIAICQGECLKESDGNDRT